MRPDLEHLPPEAAAFIMAVEDCGPLNDCGGGPPYCEIDADICENLCQLLIKHWAKSPSSEVSRSQSEHQAAEHVQPGNPRADVGNPV